MAKLEIKAEDDFVLKLSRLAARSDEVAKRAIYEAAEIVTDKVRENLEALPEESFRRLGKDESFDGLPAEQKKDLLNSLGVTPIKLDEAGNWNTKIGFDDYGRFPTKTYPKGLPNQLLARAVESGSSVRQKHPFIRPAVNATKKEALAAMERVINEEIEKTMK